MGAGFSPRDFSVLNSLKHLTWSRKKRKCHFKGSNSWTSPRPHRLEWIQLSYSYRHPGFSPPKQELARRVSFNRRLKGSYPSLPQPFRIDSDSLPIFQPNSISCVLTSGTSLKAFFPTSERKSKAERLFTAFPEVSRESALCFPLPFLSRELGVTSGAGSGTRSSVAQVHMTLLCLRPQAQPQCR